MNLRCYRKFSMEVTITYLYLQLSLILYFVLLLYQLTITMEKFGILMLLVGLVYGTDNIINLSQGKIKGSILESRNGRQFKAFQGIPYAKSPIGDLRLQVFKANIYVIKFKIISSLFGRY